MRQISIEISSNGILPQMVGDLGYDSIRGRMAYRWQYEYGWINTHRGITLSGDLQNVTGPQYTNDAIFAFLQDALPDPLCDCNR